MRSKLPCDSVEARMHVTEDVCSSLLMKMGMARTQGRLQLRGDLAVLDPARRVDLARDDEWMRSCSASLIEAGAAEAPSSRTSKQDTHASGSFLSNASQTRAQTRVSMERYNQRLLALSTTVSYTSTRPLSQVSDQAPAYARAHSALTEACITNMCSWRSYDSSGTCQQVAPFPFH